MRTICTALLFALLSGGCLNQMTQTPAFQGQMTAALVQSTALKEVPPDAAVLFVAPYRDGVQARWTRDRADRQAWLSSVSQPTDDANPESRAWSGAEALSPGDLAGYLALHAGPERAFVWCADEGLRRAVTESWPESAPLPALLPDPEKE